MAEITAAMVKKLRDRTGQAMMDCKKALMETSGDMEDAVDLLRKKGLAVLDKRGGRETKEGKVVGKVSDDGKVAILVSLCSETDFTAKNEAFQAITEQLGTALLQADTNPDSEEALGRLSIGDGKTVNEVLNDIISQTGEKIMFGPFVRFTLEGSGLLHCYVHFNGKIGTLIQIDAENGPAAAAEATKTLASDLAMHITAVNPLAVSADELDQETVAREREVAKSQVVGKPENIVDKIVDGKMHKWYKQVVLLEQPFVKDDSKTVSQLLDEVGKIAGGKLTVKRFSRIQIG
ncbi:MAG: translation elongation factor Ts [Sedimentisphaerales bacterium]|nr:translation elongation factor Ts [Sedimentisphaerales bacterium]